MDIRDELKPSKGDKLTKSSSLPDSGQNKPENVNIGARKATVSGGIGSGVGSTGTGGGRGSPRKWITSDMIGGSKYAHQVFNPKPVSEFNPTTSIQVVKKGLDVEDNSSDVVKGKDDVVKPLVYKVKKKAPADVIENPDKGKTKLTVKIHVIQNPDKVTIDVVKTVKDKAIVKKPVDVVKMVKDKVASVIDKNKASKVVVNEKGVDVVVNDVVKKLADVVEKSVDVVVNEKHDDVVVNKKPAAIVVNDLTNYPTHVSTVKVTRVIDKDKEKDNASNVVVNDSTNYPTQVSTVKVTQVVCKDTQVSNFASTLVVNVPVEVDKGMDKA